MPDCYAVKLSENDDIRLCKINRKSLFESADGYAPLYKDFKPSFFVTRTEHLTKYAKINKIASWIYGAEMLGNIYILLDTDDEEEMDEIEDYESDCNNKININVEKETKYLLYKIKLLNLYNKYVEKLKEQKEENYKNNEPKK